MDLPPTTKNTKLDISQDYDPFIFPDDQFQTFANHFDATVVEYESGSKRWTQEASTSFIESIDRTAKLLKSLPDDPVAINRLSGLQQRALSILEVEFKSILDDYQTSYNRDQNVESADSQDEFLGYSDGMILNLNKLANGLIRGRHETECSELYFFVRRNAMEQNLKFEKLSIDETQKMQWEAIEKEVSAWKNMFKSFCTSLLPSERRLVDAVFSGHTAISNTLFANLTRTILFYLLSFAEAVMMTKPSNEKLFKFLDIYQTLRDSIPEVVKLLTNDEWLVAQVTSAASLISTMLGDSIFNIFIQLENSIKSDVAKTAVPGGAVHPLTRYTMNYLTYACEYSDTLEQVFKKHKKIDQEQAPFQGQIGNIMDLLDANLEAKSRLYKDPSLRLIFMMNNGRYILQKIKGTGEMRSLMGDQWVRKRSSDLRTYHSNYKRETWTKLLQCLNHEGLNVNGKVMKPVLKERFKCFNTKFDEIYRSQTTWVVSDEQLQSELRVSISAIVIPAYRSFMGRFSQVFTPGRQTEKYIKYQPEDIETCIEELFDGRTAQHSKKRL